MTAYVAALHVQDLLADAAMERRARLVSKEQRGVPAWRRSLGGMLVSAARTLDPGVEPGPAGRRSSEGRRARASAA